MRVMGRNDAVLMIGLTVALFVIFSGPVASLLDYVREIEQTRGLHLLPALVFSPRLQLSPAANASGIA